MFKKKLKKDTKFNRILWYFWAPRLFEAKNSADEIFNRAMDLAIADQDFIDQDNFEFTCGDMIFYFEHRRAVFHGKNQPRFDVIDWAHLTYFTRSRISDFVKEIRCVRGAKLLEQINAKFDSILKTFPPAK